MSDVLYEVCMLGDMGLANSPFGLYQRESEREER